MASAHAAAREQRRGASEAIRCGGITHEYTSGAPHVGLQQMVPRQGLLVGVTLWLAATDGETLPETERDGVCDALVDGVAAMDGVCVAVLDTQTQVYWSGAPQAMSQQRVPRHGLSVAVGDGVMLDDTATDEDTEWLTAVDGEPLVEGVTETSGEAVVDVVGLRGRRRRAQRVRQRGGGEAEAQRRMGVWRPGGHRDDSQRGAGRITDELYGREKARVLPAAARDVCGTGGSSRGGARRGAARPCFA